MGGREPQDGVTPAGKGTVESITQGTPLMGSSETDRRLTPSAFTLARRDRPTTTLPQVGGDGYCSRYSSASRHFRRCGMTFKTRHQYLSEDWLRGSRPPPGCGSARPNWSFSRPWRKCGTWQLARWGRSRSASFYRWAASLSLLRLSWERFQAGIPSVAVSRQLCSLLTLPKTHSLLLTV